MQKVQQLIEQRYADIHSRQKMLVNTWMPYIEAVNEYRQTEGHGSLNDYETRQVAQCLENAFTEVAIKQKGRLNETTYQDAIAFLGVQLPEVALGA